MIIYINHEGIPVNDEGIPEFSLPMLFKVQSSCFKMESLHLHNSSHIAQAFTNLASVNLLVKRLVLKEMAYWNRLEMQWPQHSGDFDSCLEFIPGPYCNELSLNIRFLKFRGHHYIQDLVTKFKMDFSEDQNTCGALCNELKQLAQQRKTTRKQVRKQYDEFRAGEFAVKKKKEEIAKIKAQSNREQVQMIIIQRSKRIREEKTAEAEKKKREKEESDNIKEQNKRRKIEISTCRVQDCNKARRTGKQWKVCHCGEFVICPKHKKDNETFFSVHIASCDIARSVLHD